LIARGSALFARILFFIVIAWATAGLLVYLGLQLFSREQMNLIGVVAVVLGLGVGVVTWRFTKPWLQRLATEQELREGFPVHWSANLIAVTLLLSIPTLGLFAALMWNSTRRMPRHVDPQGMLLRNGNRIEWHKVTGVRKIQKRLNGLPFSLSYEFTSGPIQGLIVPNALHEGYMILELHCRVAEQRIQQTQAL
jgi:hypothetical protein